MLNSLIKKGSIASKGTAQVNSTLTSLDLEWNGVGPDGVKSLARAIEVSSPATPACPAALALAPSKKCPHGLDSPGSRSEERDLGGERCADVAGSWAQRPVGRRRARARGRFRGPMTAATPVMGMRIIQSIYVVILS